MKQEIQRHSYNPAVASLIIRIGLAAVLAYAAIDSFREPQAWLGYVPGFTTKFVAAKTSLDIISVGQLVLAVWLLVGKFLKIAAGVAALLLIGIIVLNGSSLLITFRDVGLAAAALALIFLEK